MKNFLGSFVLVLFLMVTYTREVRADIKIPDSAPMIVVIDTNLHNTGKENEI
ncbi:MAG: hypothetical protein RBQ97_02065 [Acholeplasma sp.]|nr:hypothetical protein [Acholeplasma sp.]